MGAEVPQTTCGVGGTTLRRLAVCAAINLVALPLAFCEFSAECTGEFLFGSRCPAELRLFRPTVGRVVCRALTLTKSEYRLLDPEANRAGAYLHVATSACCSLTWRLPPGCSLAVALGIALRIVLAKATSAVTRPGWAGYLAATTDFTSIYLATEHRSWLWAPEPGMCSASR